MIRELTIDTSNYTPGEALTHASNEFTHITITYDISGDRYLVDQNIDSAVQNDSSLIKVEHVNTTLYWQIILGESGWDKDRLVDHAKIKVKEKLKEIFIGGSDLDETTVAVFCMVGNLRAFAFKLS